MVFETITDIYLFAGTLLILFFAFTAQVRNAHTSLLDERYGKHKSHNIPKHPNNNKYMKEWTAVAKIPAEFLLVLTLLCILLLPILFA